MLRALALLLTVTAAGNAIAEPSARNKLFQAAYCLGAIRESRALAGKDCDGRWLEKGIASAADCDALGQIEDRTLYERHLLYTNYIWRRLPGADPEAATHVEVLTKLGEDHVKSNAMGWLDLHDRCMRDCLNWPPSPNCVSPAE